MSSPRIHRAALSRREALLFEAGVKLGGVFHQYLGIPVSAGTARELARTIRRAVALQPYVTHVSVRIRPEFGGPLGRGRFAYRYLAPPMLDVTVVLHDGPVTVTARLRHRPELRYPLMSVERVREARTRARPRRRRSRE
jgi:dihydroneopterin aldolase